MAERKLEVVLTAADKTKRAFRSVQKSLGAFADKVRGFAADLGLAFGAGGAGALAGIRNMATEMDKLAKTAAKLGTTTEELSKLRHAAEMTGVSAQTMDMALQRMTRRVAEAAQGTGEAKDALLEMGLSADDLARKTPEDALKDIADALSGVETQSDRVRLAFKLFDSEGVALINTLEGGSEALNQYGEELEHLGGVIDSKAAKAAEELNDNLTRMDALSKGAAQSIGNYLIPALNESLQFWNSFLQGKGLDVALADMTKDIEVVIPSLSSLSSEIAALKIELAGLDTSGLFGASDLLREQQIIGQLRELESQRQQILDQYSQRRKDMRDREKERQLNRESEVTEAQKEELKKREELQKNSINRRKQLLEEYVNNARSLLEQEKSLVEKIDKAGEQQTTAEDRVTRGRDLDIGDVFLNLNEAFDKLNTGDVEGAEQGIEDMTSAMDTLAERGKINLITLQQLREGLKDLAKEITATKIEKLGGETVAKGEGKEQVLDVRINKESINNQLKAVIDKGIDLPVRPYLVEDANLIEQAVARQATETGGRP